MQIALVGKSGVGKTTQERLLTERFGYSKVVSTTTRKRREYDNEVDGVDYHFISKEEFEVLIADGCLAEYATFKGNYYGIQLAHLSDDFVVVVETDGYAKLRERFPHLIGILMEIPEDERDTRLSKRGKPLSCLDEERFDSVENILRVNAAGPVESVTDRLLCIINAVSQGMSTKDYIVKSGAAYQWLQVSGIERREAAYAELEKSWRRFEMIFNSAARVNRWMLKCEERICGCMADLLAMKESLKYICLADNKNAVAFLSIPLRAIEQYAVLAVSVLPGDVNVLNEPLNDFIRAVRDIPEYGISLNKE